nr:pyroglutamyl-peptidase I [uncultured Moellerella sp.]
MKKVLVTGFEPFGGEDINPSWEVVKQLDKRVIDGCQIVALQLPCVFFDSLDILYRGIEQYEPTLVIAVGQAGGRADITIERIGINIIDASIADNQGQQPIDKTIVAEGPAAIFSTLPIKAIVAGLQAAGIPASVSQTAGTYVCNQVMYGLLNKISNQAGVRGGFIHVPYLPEQAAMHMGKPSMGGEMILRAVELAIAISLAQTEDIKMGSGATH